MKTILMAVLLLTLTACATPPRLLAAIYDSNDKCQNYYNKPNYQQPQWCGAGDGARLVTRDYRTGNYQTVTGIQK